MPECENCASHVSERYAAVFGDQADVVYACSNCIGTVYVSRGTAARPAFASRVRGDRDG